MRIGTAIALISLAALVVGIIAWYGTRTLPARQHGLRRLPSLPPDPGDSAGIDTFYRVGGWSWCVPYIAGMYALALQVHEDLTVDEFARAAIATGQYTDISVNGERMEFGLILNPAGLIERLASRPSID